LKHIFGVVLLICILDVAGADPLGLTLGAEIGLGNAAADNYNYAGKVEPVSGTPAGQGILTPFITYNKNINGFSIMGGLFCLLNFDNPQTTQLKFTVSGSYNLLFNNKTSLFTFSIEDIFKLNTYDGKTNVYQGPEQGPNLKTWNNTAVPAVQITQLFGFVYIYGKFSFPLYAAPMKTAPTPEYEKIFVFGDITLGIDTKFGFGVYLRPVLQLSPDPEKTPMAPYDDYAADRAVQQLDLGVSYTGAPLSSSIVFSFPVRGYTVYANGIKDVGFEITPTFVYQLGAQGRMRVYIMADIGNLRKDTGDRKQDRISFIPTVGFSYTF
jgi:hypothetical protein